jgi:[glutamine synthetase] adenylyltransferase / [glutamine synthetase]-adenylyl-L-tyrosine phosphorylase
MLSPSSAWPHPADSEAAGRLAERFAALGPAEAALLAEPRFAAMLAAIGGNSPFLSDLAIREAASLRHLVRSGPDAVVARALRSIARCPASAGRARVAATLRQAKRQVALATALADIGGLWPLQRVTAALSDLAEAALTTATAHLLRAAHAQDALHLAHPREPAREGGFTVLGMGKLGARELNYSSDIDLVLIYDPASHPAYADRLSVTFARLARDLCALMEARDADGYVFRTDLRLRPDPAATPPAISLPAALTYYESMGENWERAAMIKARPVAGDLALGTRFLAEIRPFIWRRHLDFAAVADIRAMKRRMDNHHVTALSKAADPVERIAGHDIKLGEGGIRGVEFAAQTLQLVWGGRDPRLREPATLDALGQLEATGHLTPAAVRTLRAAYEFLRRVEHRLQMVADRQTHRLPASAAELERFAVFMGYPDAPTFAAALLVHLEAVRDQDASLFDSPVPDEAALFTVERFRAMGFAEPERVLSVIRGWREGAPRALRSPRGRALLENILPGLLKALAAQREPDAAFARADMLLSRLAAGVHVLSLFHRRPVLLERVAAVLGAAPSLADHLAQVPAALEGLLAPSAPDPDLGAMLDRQLADAQVLEDAVAIVRRTVRGEEFRLSVAQMEGGIDADQAGLTRTALADAVLGVLLPRVMAAHAERYGHVPGGGMTVVLLGKAGGREMMAGSDLDLMLIYDHPASATESDGARRLPASTYYIRAAHALVATLTAPGAEGALYAVDMRLRPSGNKGPVAVSLAAFRRYHAEDAWTWERMALTRARCVTGPAPLSRRVAAAIQGAMTSQADPDTIRADAVAMRMRMLRDLPPHGPWDVKLRPGGQVEVEYIVQVLLLLHPRGRPATTTRVAIARLHRIGALDAAEAELLTEADRLWRTVQGMLRITVGPRAPDTLPAAAMEVLLLAAAPGCDAAAFRARLDDVAAQVRAVFNHRLGAIQ